jgi:hypothetical protein
VADPRSPAARRELEGKTLVRRATRANTYRMKMRLPLLTRVGLPAVTSSQWMLLTSTIVSVGRLAFVVG